MKTKSFTLPEIKQLHQINCSAVSLEYFMDNYCKQMLDKFSKVEVVVSENFKFSYSK